jgi:DNA-nicking Smr family endonuclease
LEGARNNVLAPLFFVGKESKEKGCDFSGLATDSPFGESVVMPPQDSIDLHPFQPRDIPSVVEEYLEQCRQAGFHQVRLIHGKGRGVQRNIVRSLLEKHPGVLSFHDAPLEAGSWGATIVVLTQLG